MKILFLGLQYNKEKEIEYIYNSKIGLQGAINTFQWNLIDGFIENNVDITLFNTIPVGTYPTKYSKFLINTMDWTYRGIMCREIGFVNLPIVKQSMRKATYIKNIKLWIKSSNGPKTIVAYSLYLPYLEVFSYIKKYHPEVNLCMIVADLPCQFGIMPKEKIKSFIFNVYGKQTMRLTKYIDYYVLLTKQMRQPLAIKNNYIVVEGIVNEIPFRQEISSRENKIILYTGTLNYQFGISNLLNAFEKIKNEDYELWICGVGEAVKEIQAITLIDSRIKYYGYLSKDDIYELQKNATVLINPRTNDGEYTKYSFPSKTMDYMASGVPILMYKLDGVPDGYDQYIYYIKDNTIQALSDKIVEVCEKDAIELYKFGNKAREFVLKEKGNIEQAKKILDLLEINK